MYVQASIDEDKGETSSRDYYVHASIDEDKGETSSRDYVCLC